MHDAAIAANADAQIGDRLITGEPMTLLMNLFMSESFGKVDLENLVFPAVMRVDYVRVYQDPNWENVGCDGATGLYPTTEYIKTHAEAYNNPNLTVSGCCYSSREVFSPFFDRFGKITQSRQIQVMASQRTQSLINVDLSVYSILVSWAVPSLTWIIKLFLR